MLRRLLALIATALVVSGAVSQTTTPPKTGATAATRWTEDDILLQESASDFQIAPDCRHVVWVKTAQDREKGESVSVLMRSSLTEREEVQLTRGPDSCDNPKWSPDGKQIAFFTDRAAPKTKSTDEDSKAAGKDETKTQIWLLNPFGGEPWPLSDLKRSVLQHEWADANTLVFTAQEEPSHYETVHEDRKDTSEVVEDEAHEPPVRLFKIDVKSKKVTRLTENDDRIEGFDLAPGGHHAVTFHQRSLHYEYDNRVKPTVFLEDLTTGERRRIFEERHFHIDHVRWTRDGKGFYASNQVTNSPLYLMAYITELYYYDLAAATATKIDLDWPRGLSSEFAESESEPPFQVTEDGFVAFLADGIHNRTARYRRVGERWERSWLTGEHAERLYGMAVGKDNQTLVYNHSTASTPPQWYRAHVEGNRLTQTVPLTELNEELKERTIARTEVVRWKGALDEEVEGLLYYPHHYEAGRKYPLVVMIHGGPMNADLDMWDEEWAYAPNLMAQRGAFVLRPNYHGSSNYGLAWLESISNGKYYDLEVPDIEKGVDALIARGLVDADRLGVKGWSNGSILTIALTTTTARYKVASAGAGDVDRVSDWANCQFGAAFDNYYLGKSPLEDPELYWKKSPFYRLDRVRTPTIIFFGTDDRKVPTEQGWMHYRALQQLGKAEVRFLLFPGEDHSLKKLAHQRRKLHEELAWFDRYLFGTLKAENESLKKGSPLARLLVLRHAARDGKRYGHLEKGVLVPETVPYEGVQLGRFEVTQAQFAEFDRDYTVEPGRENYPAHGITCARARAYCAWLSKATGQTYRLPEESEAEKIYGEESGEENTLDAWAGYTVNPEDAVRLREKLQELPGAAPLLREVGSYKGTDTEEPVFDLGGNVSEWVESHGGEGRLFGASADTPADPRQKVRKPGPEYIGFRVIKGEASSRK